MSESKSTRPRRAARNPYSQVAANESLAVFLASRNLPVPSALKRPAERPLRSNKRQKNGKHENNSEQNDVNQFDHTEAPLPQTYNPPGRQSPTPSSTYQQPEEPSEGISSGPRLCNDDLVLGPKTSLDDLKKMAHFIDALQEPDPRLDITDKHFVKALGIFLTTNASEATYNAIRFIMKKCYPNDPFLSFGQMKRCVEQLSTVVPISYDMCPDTQAAA